MEIRPVDRLILVMLTEIYDALKIQREIDPKFLRSALFGGHDWALEWELWGITKVTPDDPAIVTQVVDVLDAYDMLELSYDDLDASERRGINEHDVRFPGFDGNNETEHMSIARFLVEEMGRWERFKGRDFNSHHPTLARSRAVARRFSEIRSDLANRAGPPRLTAAEIKGVVGVE